MQLSGDALEFGFADRGTPLLYVLRGVLGEHPVVKRLHPLDGRAASTEPFASNLVVAAFVSGRGSETLGYVLAYVVRKVILGHLGDWGGVVVCRSFFADV